MTGAEVGLNLEGWEDFQSKGVRGKSSTADKSNSYEQTVYTAVTSESLFRRRPD